MTILNFSKTRIVYWDSYRSTLVLPNNADTLPAEVSILTSSDALPYEVCKVTGTNSTSNIGHNWHMIPYNTYGLYCTPAELNAMVENSNSFTPLKCSYSIGHTIPLSRTATTSSTQLSFNNTIYSLIVDLPANDQITTASPFTDIATYLAFCRTFDGSRYDNLNRNTLPVPDLYYKIPRCKNQGTFEGHVAEGTNVSTSDLYTNFDEVGTTMPNGTTTNVLANAYLPELLQDNSNVKCLYPGENEDRFDCDLSEWKPLSTIPTDIPFFNEAWANLDCRMPLINSDAAFPNSLMMAMNLVPVSRGPQDIWRVNDSSIYDSPYCSAAPNANDSSVKQASRFLWDALQQQKGGATHKDYYTKSLPTKFIKCLPIMAQDNTPVIHTICGTITWNLDVEVTDRMYRSINPLKWQMFYPKRIIVRTRDDGGTITGASVKETIVSGCGMRPLNETHSRSLKTRMRSNKQRLTYLDTDGNYMINDFTPAQISSVGTANTSWNSIVPGILDMEVAATCFNNNVPNNVLSTTFNPDGAFVRQTRSRTAAARAKKPKPSS